MKTFAAIGTGNSVIFSFEAENGKEARETVKQIKTWSENVLAVRLLRADDMGPCGAEIETR